MTQPALTPPIQQTGFIAWLKHNLFSTWLNSIVSVSIGLLLAWSIFSLTRWMILDAKWDLVWINLKLLSTYRYPVDLLWRLFVCIALVLLLMGISAGVAKGGMGRIVMSAYYWLMGFCTLIAIIALFAFPSVRWLWLMTIIAGFAGFSLGRFFPNIGRYLAILWSLSWFACLFLMLGFGTDASNPMRYVAPGLWGGIQLTFFLSVTGIVLSFPLGIALALGRQSKLPAIKYFCVAYIEIIRGAPLITWLFTASLLLPLFLGGYRPEALIRAQVMIILFAAAYMAENVRGGLQAIPKGQREAAHALGLNPWDSMRLIILPQALRAVIPAIVGLFIGLFKDTSLVTIVGLHDLFSVAIGVTTQPEARIVPGGIVRELFIFMSVFYWFFCYRMSVASKQLEQELGLGTR